MAPTALLDKDRLPNGHSPSANGHPVKSRLPRSTTVAGVINAVAAVSLGDKVATVTVPNGQANGIPKGQANGVSNGHSQANGVALASPAIPGLSDQAKLGPVVTCFTPVPQSNIDPQDIRATFRDAASSVWVITGAHDGKPVGFTATTVNCVSVDQPMITFNIGRSSSSLDALSRSLRFAVHLLDHDASDAAKRFAQATHKRFEDTSTWGWGADGLPELQPGALARLSGSIVSLSAAGDNLLALGRVESISRRQGHPLVYHGGIYRSLHTAEGEAPRPGRRIYLNAFDMCCVGHQSPGLWAAPGDRADTYKDIEYWTDLAKLLDQGGFDTLFLADVVGTYDVYKGSRDAAVRSSAQVPVNDPVAYISAMAAVTKRLGFGVTVSLTYELPYAFARRMSTLDHLTKGRVAWNIVTSYLKAAAVNLGLETQVPHDERYNIAAEFVEVCYKLWEGSWEDDAVVKDRAKGIFADPAKIHDINHKGKYFQVPGAHLCEPSPQRTPFLFQAGASTKGQAFAARHAEAVFISGPSPAYLKKTVASIRQAAVDAGRRPDDVKIFSLLTIITGATDADAEAKHAEYRKYASIEGALALYGGWAGVDLSQVGVDEPLEYVENDAIRSVNQMWSKQNGIDEVWTPRKIAEKISIGGLGPLIVGGGKSIADQLERWVEESGVDGFNLAYAITPGTFEDIVEYVVPELRRRGRLPPPQPEDAPRRTLREQLGGPNATPHVAKNHPAYQYKVSK